MRKMKRNLLKVLSVCVLLALFLTAMPVAMATEQVPSSEPASDTDGGQISPRTEEIYWVYRTYNGVRQKRLWSATEGVWLTDWIDCE